MKFFKYLGRLFGDKLMKAAAIIFVLIVVLVIFNFRSNLPEQYPLFGFLDFMLVPILVVAGGVVFVMAIWRFSK